MLSRSESKVGATGGWHTYMKTIFTIACRIPGGFGEYVAFHSKTSLLDADLILFSPSFRYEIGERDHMGKTLLGETESFELQSYIDHWQRELDTVLRAGKNVLVLMNTPKEVYVITGQGEHTNIVQKRFVRLLRNYELLPFSMKIVESNGSSMALHAGESILRNYWRNFGQYSTYRCFIADANELRPLVGTRHGDQVVGGIIQTFGGGALVLLPWIDLYQNEFFQGFDERFEFVDSGYDLVDDYTDSDEEWTPKAKKWGKDLLDTLEFLDETLGLKRESTPIPHWARSDRFKTLQEATLSEQLLQIQCRISELEGSREEIEEGLAGAGYLKPLLFGQGPSLEKAVRAAMKLIGFEASSYRDSDSEFDVVLTYAERRYLGEVEGRDNRAIDIDKIRQLEGNIYEDFERDEVSKPAEGVLFGNAFRLQPPSERPRLHFTQKCFSAAKRNGTALIRTCDLFEVAKALADHPDEQFAASCREAILNTKGKEVVFPTVPEDEVSTTNIEKT